MSFDIGTTTNRYKLILTPPKLERSPLIMKNLKNCPKAVFDSAMVHRMQHKKNPALYKEWFLKKKRKHFNEIAIMGRFGSNEYFWGFSCFFLETILCKGLGFFALHSGHQGASFEISKTIFGQFFIFFLS